jgi:hypothetical protein
MGASPEMRTVKTDSRGLAVSTTSADAARHYRLGVDLLLSAWPGAAEALDAAIAADPGFALAHAARARLHAIRAEPAEARARIAEAERLAQSFGDERERSHVAALSLAIQGRSAEALACAVAHLETWPRDVVIFSLPMGAFGLFAFSGMADHDQARVDLCERHARRFADDDWWFLTYRGWSHTENGAPGFGRGISERGFALRRENANAAHAVSHAMHEQGASHEAEAMIAAWLPSYDRSGVLHGHICWHAALAALERGDGEKALAIYERDVQASSSLGMPINVMTDAVSLLWRMQAYGHAVPAALWKPVARHAGAAFPRPGFAFADVHMGLLEAATRDVAAAERRIASLTALVEAGAMAAGPVVPAICRAALAFMAEDYGACASILEPFAADVARIGGSGAQREMIEDTLLIALMKSGASEKARALLDLRLHRRPSPRDEGWRRRAARAV